jgi:hypothetical protein
VANDRQWRSFSLGAGMQSSKSVVVDWRGMLVKVDYSTGVPDVHALRFRDTFAVELPAWPECFWSGFRSCSATPAVKIAERVLCTMDYGRAAANGGRRQPAWKAASILSLTISVQPDGAFGK